MELWTRDLLVSRLRVPRTGTLRQLAVVVISAFAVLVAAAPLLRQAPDEEGLHLGVAAALGLTAVTLAVARGLPDWLLAALAIGAPNTIVLVFLARTENADVLPMLLLWSAMASSYFHSRVTAVLNMVVIVVGFALAVGVSPDPHLTSFTWAVVVMVCGACTMGVRVVAERGDVTIRMLNDRARRDPLTGLLNRRGFEEHLESAWEGGQSLAVAFFDLDHFKSVNDTHGHQSGDAVLQEFAVVLRGHVRDDDVVARTGGEEFGLVLPGRSPDAALDRARAIVDAFAARRVQVEDAVVRCTVSAGVAVRCERHTTAPQLCRDADRALYLAKEAGRDRAVLGQAVA